MGAGASAKLTEASPEDRKAAVAELTPEQVAELAAALRSSTTGKSAENLAQVKKNKAALNDLESKVYENKQKLYAERAFIEENRCLILKNYSAAFVGNRQMANQNTDDIFRNRKSIVKSVKAVDAVQLNFVESHLNRARVDAIEHRANMNGRVAAVNEKMADINKQLIEVNRMIMEGNKEIVEFNTKHMGFNTKILNGELSCAGEGCNPEDNAKRIAENAERIEKITKQAADNTAKHDEVLAKAKENRDKILKNSEEIMDRRAAIEENHKAIAANSGKISEMILKD